MLHWYLTTNPQEETTTNIIHSVEAVHSNPAVADEGKLCCLLNSASKLRKTENHHAQPHIVSPVRSFIMKRNV